jgi:hypothetical protein
VLYENISQQRIKNNNENVSSTTENSKKSLAVPLTKTSGSEDNG